MSESRFHRCRVDGIQTGNLPVIARKMNFGWNEACFDSAECEPKLMNNTSQ